MAAAKQSLVGRNNLSLSELTEQKAMPCAI
jgi:hypothetical protein